MCQMWPLIPRQSGKRSAGQRYSFVRSLVRHFVLAFLRPLVRSFARPRLAERMKVLDIDDAVRGREGDTRERANELFELNKSNGN